MAEDILRMKSQKWFLEFSKYLKDFEEEYNQSRSELSPIAYALKTGRIPSAEYIKWAQKNYSLPYVQSEYFKSQLPPSQDWKDWKNEYKWSPEIVPLGLWDGHLLVACLQVPLQFPISLHPVFVLADFPNIEKTYTYYVNSEKGSSQAKTKPIEFKQETQTNVAVEQTFNKNFELSELPDLSEDQKNGELLNLEEAPQLEGLDLNMGMPSTPDLSTDSLENLDLSITENTNPSSIEGLNLTNTSSIKKESSFSQKSKAEIDLSTTLRLPDKILDEVNKGMPLFIALKKEYTQQFEDFTQEVFSKNKNIYDKMILFSVDPSESYTVPVSWTDTIAPRNKNIETIALNEPSIFKIVSSTIKSYHGYVVLNETNEKFFDFWNLGQVPGNITMCPIIVKNKIVGFLMGLGEPNSYNWNILKKMESITTEVTLFFTDFNQNAKAS